MWILPVIILTPNKTSFQFTCYTKKSNAIPPLSLHVLRQRMFIAGVVDCLLIHSSVLCIFSA
ncbi:hypothetical protein C3432_19820 [Citrobacter amalonaticus]|uniref:Uncharacterized protein n=1 Tax=Citrobacter amalonaticus TaxID=35703 RepID=A0A2S4RXX8_CITAM|nr:hypothetical protein C3432_19820 [Citrobacter amalonaticus]POT74532.1 hypothetical protein C3436_17460 [Citrobacter amalonaticus]POU65331.1 hypothetical protein C3430_14200 [Citrobacter amalonaticus]POV04166.1 hypothetical protein C3424_19140 [Citrobacter amalonaticus]